MRKSIYTLHRTLSIIIALPVLLWAGSGFMHPLMTNIRPAIAAQQLPVLPINPQRIRFPVTLALKQHHLDSFSNFRLVHIDTNWFYQVQPVSGIPVYLSCTNGNILAAGDWLYAQYLARQFLEGPADGAAAAHAGMGHMAPGSRQVPMPPMTGSDHLVMANMPSGHSVHDCCGAATDCVLNPVKGAKVANVSMVSAFDKEYKSINRLLPVYRVSFERADGIRVYVETTQDRFAFAMDRHRAVFDEIFRYFHTYGWLDALGKGRLAVELTLASLAFLTSCMGVYIFFITRSKAARGNSLMKARRNHRYVSLVACLFTLMWTFSGAWHALSKFGDDDRDKYMMRTHFSAEEANYDLGRLLRADTASVNNISLVRFEGRTWWRLRTSHGPSYVNTDDLSVLPDGDSRYAKWLAMTFSGRSAGDVRSVTPVTVFGDEYNFTDKRLPVRKVSFTGDDHARYYIETSTGRLASRVDDRTKREGWSFSIFHKHHFMDWGGKAVRDASTMFWAFAQLVMVTVGLILYFRWRARQKKG